MATHSSIELFFQEGTSDKVYTAAIVEDGGAYTVQVRWGRRGSTLNSGNKAVRVPLAQAQKTYDRLVAEKTNKGYQPITEEVKPAAVAPPEGEGSGSRVQGRRPKVGPAAQLLEPLDEAELARFLDDDAVLAQQKLDGVRVLVTVGSPSIATNRDGQATSVPATVLEGLSYLPDGTIVDGEVIGAAYWLFDVLAIGARDVRSLGYEARFRLLDQELSPGLDGETSVLPIAVGAKAKRALAEQLRASHAEGVVFKQRKAPYESGRRSTQRKFKFVKSADVVVLSNAGNAYLMAVYDGGVLFEVGKVFAGTTNESRRALDARLGEGDRPVIEVRYLYATDDEQLYQPVFVRLRDDKPAEDCLRAQLRKTSRAVL